MTQHQQLVTIKSAAKILGVTPLTLRNWDKKGKLTALRHPINNYRVYKLSEIEKLIAEMTTISKPTERPIKKSVRRLDVLHLE